MTLSLESVSIQGGFGFISTLLQAQPFLSKSWRCKYNMCLLFLFISSCIYCTRCLAACSLEICALVLFYFHNVYEHWYLTPLMLGFTTFEMYSSLLVDTFSVWTALNSFIGQLVFAACLWSWKLKYMYLYFHMFYLLCQSWITNAVFQINTQFKKTHL